MARDIGILGVFRDGSGFLKCAKRGSAKGLFRGVARKYGQGILRFICLCCRGMGRRCKRCFGLNCLIGVQESLQICA